MRLFGNIFWGLILILIGLLYLLKQRYGINLPILRTVLGFVLIYIGICFLTGYAGISLVDKSNLIFSSDRIIAKEEVNEYNIIFSNGVIDLRDYMRNIKDDPKASNKQIKVNTIFSKGTIILEEGIPYRINTNTAFGATNLPNRSVNGFGDMSYANQGDDSGIKIKVDTVFGRTDVIENSLKASD
jgi:hypothetical protein